MLNTQICIICKKNCSRCNILSNGHLFHYDCYQNIISEIQSGHQITSDIDSQMSANLRKLNDAKTISYRIKSFFGGESINENLINENILNLKSDKEIIKAEISPLLKQLSSLYDYWAETPPDWGLRREIVKQKSFNQCNRCGEEYLEKHVHHKVQISKGGSHRIDNLEYLCVSCHSEAHHGRDVSIENKSNLTRSKSAYAKRLEIIQYAIDNDEIIQFSYRKYYGDKSVRAISPECLEQKGKSLCVVGYCYLRNEDRIFAIKRMSRVKIVDEPGNCYDK